MLEIIAVEQRETRPPSSCLPVTLPGGDIGTP